LPYLQRKSKGYTIRQQIASKHSSLLLKQAKIAQQTWPTYGTFTKRKETFFNIFNVLCHLYNPYLGILLPFVTLYNIL
jgi:hypothetical protein